MAFVKREIKDRVVQYPRRYQLVEVQPGIFDFIPMPGTIIEEGTPINKAYLQPIEDMLEKITKDYTIEVITSSQNWIVPENVWTVDVFMVNGGKGGNGGAGGKGYPTTGSSGTILFAGGDGGSAGAAAIILGYKVIPGQIIPIIIGAGGEGGNGGVYTEIPSVNARGSKAGDAGADGGITSFDNLSLNASAILGSGGTGNNGHSNGENGNEKTAYDNNVLIKNLCILNGIRYGGGGGGGGGNWAATTSLGGIGAICGGNGGDGLYKDNPDLTGISGTDGVFGGGGGGGGSAATNRVAGTVTGGKGGNGGDGVVVIRYREGN